MIDQFFLAAAGSEVFSSVSAMLASSSSSSDDRVYLLLLGPAAGIAFYTRTYLRYRNTDKRDVFERRTAAELSDLRGYDQLSGSIKGTKDPHISRRNSNEPLKRLGPGTTVRDLTLSE